jgi:hypothetical protein
MNLEKEALEYAVSVYEGEKKDVYENSSRLDFIAGATSKWVKAEKIKAQIEAVRAVDTYGLIHMLKYYEQQLKELTLKNK